MPPRSNGPRTPPPPPARRLGPLLPGSWVALVVLACLVAFALVQYSPHREISYSALTKLVQQNKLLKVTITGQRRLTGELRDANDELAKEYRISGGRFTALLPAPDERGTALLSALEKNGVDVQYDDDQASWLPGAFLTFLVTGLILFLFLAFVLPRLRDP